MSVDEFSEVWTQGFLMGLLYMWSFVAIVGVIRSVVFEVLDYRLRRRADWESRAAARQELLTEDQVNS